MFNKEKFGLFDGKKFNFLLEADQKQRFNFGVFMWAAFYAGYFIFCLNWIIFSNLQGSDGQGWISVFKNKGLGQDVGTREVRQDAVNYSITLARGFATIGVAWLMSKLSHRWAALIAFGLNTAALPLIFAPHYSLLVLGRMLMATGGTMLIILIQPVMSRFFDLKGKGILSAATPTAYILAAFVANVLFVYEGQGNSVKTWFLSHWQWITGVCAGLSYLPFLAYVLFGRNFSTSDNEEELVEQNSLPQNTYSGIIKEKGTWFWSIFYSFLLVASLLVSLKVPVIFKNINKELVESTLSSANISWSKLYVCFFYAGCFCGMCWGKWAKTKYQRKPIVAICCVLGLICWLMIFGGVHIKGNKPAATTLIFWSAFLFAFFAMGIQAIILYIPHEYKENNNAKRITIFYAYLWGIGYIIFTVYQIIVSSFIGMDKAGGTSCTGSYIAAGLITLFVLLFAIFSLTIKEPRPEYKFLPRFDTPGDLKYIFRKRPYRVK